MPVPDPVDCPNLIETVFDPSQLAYRRSPCYHVVTSKGDRREHMNSAIALMQAVRAGQEKIGCVVVERSIEHRRSLHCAERALVPARICVSEGTREWATT